MAPATLNPPTVSRVPIQWRPTKIMNMRDLSKDDDFLSHLLVEKLGTGSVPLLVHKMDPTRRLPKVDAHDLLAIVRRVIIFIINRRCLLLTSSFLYILPLFRCSPAGCREGACSTRYPSGSGRTSCVRMSWYSPNLWTQRAAN